MRIRFELPPESRSRVEAERLRAYHALKQGVQDLDFRRRNDSFVRCVMRIFIAFVREACEFAKQSRDWAWSDSQLDRRCQEFLLQTVADAWRDRGRDLGIRTLASDDPFGKIYLDDHASRIIKETPEWQQYEEMLLEALEAQSTGAISAAEANSKPGQTGEPAPEQNAIAPGQLQPATVANGGSGMDRRALTNGSLSPEAGTGVLFPKRAAWLQSEMAKRDSMTPYRLHKSGGPDPKTIKRILDGKPVGDGKLKLVVQGLSFQSAAVSLEDIPRE